VLFFGRQVWYDFDMLKVPTGWTRHTGGVYSVRVFPVARKVGVSEKSPGSAVQRLQDQLEHFVTSRSPRKTRVSE
jgi:hypothetical protein